VRLNLPMAMGAVGLLVLGVALAVLMPEAGFRRPTSGRVFGLARTFAPLLDGIRLVRSSSLRLTLLALAAAFFGLASEGFDRL